MRSTIILVALLASVASSLPEILRRQGQCADVHILVARASNEQKGEGMIGGLSGAIKTAVKRADSEAVDYPAALDPYASSEIKGVVAAKAQLTAYTQKCPKAKVVLMGYSQVRIIGSLI
jgi:acetylxylan esterase